MRNKAAVILGIALAIGGLVILNAISYAPVVQKPDTEISANRSTFNAGAGGCKALYDFLSEGGFRVSRWTEPLKGLSKAGKNPPDTLVIIGRTQLGLENQDIEAVKDWVLRGHKLVLIDRFPDQRFLVTGDWSLALSHQPGDFLKIRSDDLNKLTENVETAVPVQPTADTHSVSRVQPSHLAGLLHFELTKSPDKKAIYDADASGDDEDDDEPPPPPSRSHSPSPNAGRVVVSQGGFGPPPARASIPIVEMASPSGGIVATWKLGNGTVTVLSDPFIVSNAGISMADNLQLAVNLLGDRKGLVAFDEYDQGHAAQANEIAAYFEGTPVLPITFQIVFVVLLVLWTGATRFARPIPLIGTDRRSSLEFVGSMAELQQRAKAYDLAIENVYMRIRRLLVRYAGGSFDLPRGEIAVKVAQRSGLDAQEIEDLMRKSEAVINGDSANASSTLELIRRLRRLEQNLGLGTRHRDARQSKLFNV